MTLRLWLLFGTWVVGAACGFVYHVSTRDEVPAELAKDKIVTVATKEEEIVAEGLRIPAYAEVTGVRESQVTADKAVWYPKRQVLVMENPVLLRYADDGTTVVSKAEGEEGELFVEEARGALGTIQAIRLFGNTRITTFKEQEDR